MQCGCMPCAHQRAANNHKEQTKPDTSCQTTQQTHCAPSSSGLAFLLGYSTKVLFTALTTSPEPPKSVYIKSLIAANC